MENTIHFVVFSSHHNLFGVYADQVEELLDEKDLCIQEEVQGKQTISYKGDKIRFIDFSSWLESKQSDQTRRQMTGLPSVRSRNVLIIQNQQYAYIGIGLEHPEELIAVSITQIHALPALMQKIGLRNGIWGIACIEERLIMLIDFSHAT